MLYPSCPIWQPPAPCGQWAAGVGLIDFEIHCECEMHTQLWRPNQKQNISYFPKNLQKLIMCWNDHILPIKINSIGLILLEDEFTIIYVGHLLFLEDSSGLGPETLQVPQLTKQNLRGGISQQLTPHFSSHDLIRFRIIKPMSFLQLVTENLNSAYCSRRSVSRGMHTVPDIRLASAPPELINDSIPKTLPSHICLL